MVTAVPAKYIHEVWQSAALLFAPAIQRANGRFNADDVFSDLVSGDTSLWIAADDDGIAAAVCVRIVDYPRRRFARYELVGSKPHTMSGGWESPLLDAIEAYAKNAMNCDGVEAGGRLGWAKIGSSNGYHVSGVFVEKDI
jgi:hypothetical protein